MIIERKPKIEPVFLSTLNYGDCFEHDEAIFMVVNLCHIEARCPACDGFFDGDDLFERGNSTIAVALSDDDGCVYNFKDIKVTPIIIKAIEV